MYSLVYIRILIIFIGLININNNLQSFVDGSLYVKGPYLFDKGDLVLLRGIARPSLEWWPYGEKLSMKDYQNMKDWGSNVVRLSLNQDYWLNTSKHYNADYKDTINTQVEMIKSLGMYVILDLHWSDDGDLQGSPSQKIMADQNSIQFWKELAETYKNDTNVVFEMYNEPMFKSWYIWRNGGLFKGKKYVGMQQLLDTIRNTGANNVVIANGMRWGFDLYHVKSFLLDGYNIMYGTHPYNFTDKASKYWDHHFGDLSEKFPIIATEFGEFTCESVYTEEFIDYADRKGIHWTAWGWFPKDCLFPSLIVDWDGTPSKSGKAVKHYLSKFKKNNNNNNNNNNIIPPSQEDLLD
ncbi:hypothetical protein DFA_04938 [Cavenderia fasciculata]|uniref:Glycoside hydrolase family 5 domain-containing protein n=1 Tax=Cavenderia fasciculata TaxID=261658 RepID=F4PMF8_CACFS|nr:uncharacterized protein DFA_04938 [Cavenderia fasciculata]EGG22808.1 hypothetical protein DFA_04938 [Cavenderia fasciculata]|eukprot:XP_004360659.1 hypothetical protein DFA_04938 [Cavenderia fasciculata]